MNIKDKLVHLKQNNRKALSLFVTAGYPTLESTVPLVVALANSGADIIELGIPFSDPVADGPTIQQSSDRALRNGVTVSKTLEMAEQIRKQSTVPLVLMGYANPVFAFGLEKFMERCSSAGVDGAIIADLALEESKEYISQGKKHNVATIFLAAPTTSRERLLQLDRASTGFLYCVSITGVTGERQALTQQAEQFIKEARTCVKNNPLLVGFGVSTPEDARRMAALSDGVIIGSALTKILSVSPPNEAINNATDFVRSIRTALDTTD